MSTPAGAPRAVLVDDEPLARENVRLVLGEEDIDFVAECGTGAEAVRAITAHDPHLVFLDIELPDMDGFQVLARLPPDRRPAVVFVTAYREHAVEAFEVHAADYVVKPFSDVRLREATRRATGRWARGETGLWDRLADLVESLEETGQPLSAAPEFARRLVVGERESRRVVRVEDVDYLEADGNYVRVHTDGEEHLVRSTLTGLLDRLDPGVFVRIHRSTVVNLDRVREIKPWFAGRYVTVLRDGERLRVSRTYRDALLELTH